MSTKSIAEKLLIKANTRIWISHVERREMIEPLPAQVELLDAPQPGAIGLIFAADASDLRSMLDLHRELLPQTAILWVAYPKANRSDINRDTLWPILGEYGMRPNGQVAIDEVWSALRFRALKPGESQFMGGAG